MLPAMLVIALSEAATSTIVNVLLWFVIFPAFVTALIGIAIARSYGEKLENDEHGDVPPVPRSR